MFKKMGANQEMNMSNRLLVLAALAAVSVSGCQQAAKDAGKDTTASQIQTPAETSVTKPVEPVGAPAIATTSQVTPAPKGQIKAAGPPKTEQLGLDQARKAAETARADSVKRAQAQAVAKAEAIRTARLDSLKQAEAARARARPEPVVTPAEVASAAGAGQSAQGKTPYEDNCRKCHGVRGVPPKTMQAKFPKIVTFDAAFFAKHSDDSVVTVLTKGKNEDMKSFKDKLTHAQMVAVAAYIRSFGQ
jgi:mono/diheme cytochrome c family protein